MATIVLEMGAYSSNRLTAHVVSEIDKLLRPILREYAISVYIVGSVRRGNKSDFGDLDYLLVDGNLPRLHADLIRFYQNRGHQLQVKRSGTSVLTVLVPFDDKEYQVEFNVCSRDNEGAALLHHTGSMEFNVGLRAYAKTMGLSLSQYGLFSNGRKIVSDSEESIFHALSLKFIPVHDRESFWTVKDKYKI